MKFVKIIIRSENCLNEFSLKPESEFKENVSISIEILHSALEFGDQGRRTTHFPKISPAKTAI